MRISLICLFVALWFGFFFERGAQLTSAPISGVIYSLQALPEEPIKQMAPIFNVTEVKIFENAEVAKNDSFQTTMKASQEEIKNKAVQAKAVVKVSKKQVLPTEQSQGPALKPAVLAPTVPPATAAIVDPPEEAPKKDEFSTYSKAVSDGMSSFFFNNSKSIIKDVTVEVLSLTPFQGEQDIIKFRITNNQPEFFFILNVSLYEKDKLLNAKTFFERFVQSKKSLDCLAVIPRKSHTKLSLILSESGGGKRTFKLEVPIP